MMGAYPWRSAYDATRHPEALNQQELLSVEELVEELSKESEPKPKKSENK